MWLCVCVCVCVEYGSIDWKSSSRFRHMNLVQACVCMCLCMCMCVEYGSIGWESSSAIMSFSSYGSRASLCVYVCICVYVVMRVYVCVCVWEHDSIDRESSSHIHTHPPTCIHVYLGTYMYTQPGGVAVYIARMLMRKPQECS